MLSSGFLNCFDQFVLEIACDTARRLRAEGKPLPADVADAMLAVAGWADRIPADLRGYVSFHSSPRAAERQAVSPEQSEPATAGPTDPRSPVSATKAAAPSASEVVEVWPADSAVRRAIWLAEQIALATEEAEREPLRESRSPALARQVLLMGEFARVVPRGRAMVHNRWAVVSGGPVIEVLACEQRMVFVGPSPLTPKAA